MLPRCDLLKLAAASLWLVILIFSSCSTPTSSEVTLEISQSELNFGVSLRSLDLNLRNQTDHSLNWTVTGYPDWIKLEQLEGDLPGYGTADLKVLLDRFQLDDGNHTGAISLQSGKETRTVEVSCMVNGPYLYVYEPSLDFGCETETLSLSLENIGNEATRFETEIDSDWLTVSPEAGRIADDPLELIIQVHRDADKHEFDVPYSGMIKFVPDNPEFHTEELQVIMEVPNPYT